MFNTGMNERYQVKITHVMTYIITVNLIPSPYKRVESRQNTGVFNKILFV